MDWHRMHVQAIEKHFKVNKEQGLTEKSVQKQQAKYGKNELEMTEKQTAIQVFVKQFQDFIIFILLGATCIAALLGEFVDAIAILTIVFMNAIIGYFQESRAEKALEKLKQLAAPKMIVLRNGQWMELDAKEAVPGDIVKLQVGDRVPADIRLIESHHLTTEEAALTGESTLNEKYSTMINTEANVPIHDQHNICFKGTLIMSGSGVGIIVQTGMDTEIGKIATLIDSIEQVQTPLQWKLAQLGKTLVITVLALTIITVLIGIYHGNPLYDMFLAGISLAVAVIPEGLPAIVTVVLSIGVQRMLKKRVIVRKLAAVETLGCATIICTDKTGTITENKMKVEEIWLGDQIISVSGNSDEMIGKFQLDNGKLIEEVASLHKLLLYGALCNDASLSVKKGKYVMEGNPTDSAILVAARKYHIQEQVQKHYPLIDKKPFDTVAKQMAVTIQLPNREQIEIIKGAPEVIMESCQKMLDWNDRLVPIQAKKIERQIKVMTQKALRVIAISYREKSRIGQGTSSVFLGLIGIFDPPRPGVLEAIRECRQAGVRTMMITGDHPHTAGAIGQLVGMDMEKRKIITGQQLEELSEQELEDQLDHIAIVARVNPTQKLTIIQALQKQGHIVAMTGDGINDAPAMKASNIGISMGITGTDVTKEAAHMILVDDNFTSIKEAIQEGRHVYENIRKFIRYLLTSNVGEIFVMLVAMIIGLPLPLIPIQILWVNLVTDGLPAIALGLEKSTVNRMNEPPRNPKENIFARGLAMKIISRGICIGIVTLVVFISTYMKFPEQIEYARTMAFTTLVLAQLIHVFDCRSEKGIFGQHPFSNPLLLLASLSSFILLLVVLYQPNLQFVFQTVSLTMFDWFFIVIFSVIPSIIFPRKQSRK